MLFGAAALLFVLPLFFAALDQATLRALLAFDEPSFQRALIWQADLGRFLTSPLWGTGFAALHPVETLTLQPTGPLPGHGALLSYLGSTGLIGTAMFLTVVTQGIRHVAHAVVQRPGMETEAALALVFVAVMFATVEPGLQHLPLTWLFFWLGVGLVLPLERWLPIRPLLPARIPVLVK